MVNYAKSRFSLKKLSRLKVPAISFLLLAIFSGCKNYSVSVNENLVYSPPGIFTDFSLPDPNLQDCVDDTIADEHLTEPEQLTRLYCTSRDIITLEGLKIFDRLQYLGLENNKLTTIEELALLPLLKQVNLAGNRITDASPLKALDNLTLIDLTDNPTLDCSTVEGLNSGALELRLPEHCRG